MSNFNEQIPSVVSFLYLVGRFVSSSYFAEIINQEVVSFITISTFPLFVKYEHQNLSLVDEQSETIASPVRRGTAIQRIGSIDGKISATYVSP